MPLFLILNILLLSKRVKKTMREEKIIKFKYEDSIYAMGNQIELTKADCSYFALAKEISTLNHLGKKILDPDIEGIIEIESKELEFAFCRKDGGYIDQIRNHLNVDLELFDEDNLEHQCEKFKILYMFYMLKNKLFPRMEVIQLLGKPSMENLDNSVWGWETKNGDVINYITDLLKKELSEQYIRNVNDILYHITSAWDNSLDSFRFQMDFYDSIGAKYDLEEVIHLLESELYESSEDTISKFGQSSPIAVLYLRIMQLQQIGQIKDIMEINRIQIESNYNVPTGMIEDMKGFAVSKVRVNEIEKYIDKNVSKIAKYVYLKEDVGKKERKKIRYHKEKVPTIYDFCLRARPFYFMEDVPNELFIISCLQAILLDSSNETFDYIFHGYQEYMKHKPQVQNALKGEKEKVVDAMKVYWVRKVLDHWYANTGRYNLRCSLRRLENICDDILLHILSYPDFNKMLQMHNFYHSKIVE